MFKYITLATEKEEYPSFDIMIDGEVVESWDSLPYLIEEVYPYLKGEKMDDVLDDKLSYYKVELLEMFEEAFSLGILVK